MSTKTKKRKKKTREEIERLLREQEEKLLATDEEKKLSEQISTTQHLPKLDLEPQEEINRIPR